MQLSATQIIQTSAAIKATTIASSDNFILTISGVLNIYNNLTQDDCASVLAAKKLVQIQFASFFNVSDETFRLINKHFLTLVHQPTLHFILNDLGVVNNLSCLKLLPNLQSLNVDVFNNNQLNTINQYCKLKTLAIIGNGISIQSLTQQQHLQQLFLAGKLKDIETVSTISSLKKITFSKLTLKNLDCLTPLSHLQELHFMLGSAINYQQLPQIGKLQKLSFTMVKQLTESHLLPINKMQYLTALKFDTQPHLTNLNWLTQKQVKVEIINCKNFGNI